MTYPLISSCHRPIRPCLLRNIHAIHGEVIHITNPNPIESLVFQTFSSKSKQLTPIAVGRPSVIQTVEQRPDGSHGDLHQRCRLGISPLPCPPFFQAFPHLWFQKVSGGCEEPSTAEGSFIRWKVHLLLEGLAPHRPKCDRVRFDRVDRAIQHSGDQWQQPDGPLLPEHRYRACSLAYRPGPHVTILVVVGYVASGAVPVPHLRPDRIQGKDRGVLLSFETLYQELYVIYSALYL